MALVRHPWWIIGLMVVTLVTYAPLRQAGYVHEDVPFADAHGRDWLTPRTLTSATFGLQADATVGAVHFGGLAIHLLNGLLLALLIPSTAIVGLFLLHPIQSQAVSYLSARADLLWGTAMLVTLLASKVAGWKALPLIAFCLCLCWSAKESGIMALALLCLWKPPHKALIGVAAVTGLIVALPLALSVSRWTAPALDTWCFLALQSAALWRLLALVVWPFGFTPVHDWYAVPQALGVLAFLGLIACAVYAYRSRSAWPRASFAVLWALVALAPRFLLRAPSLLTESHLYVPLMGLWLAPAISLSRKGVSAA